MIFISHSSRDRKIAETLCAAIEARGHQCWIASRDVQAGQNFQDAIVEAIHAAHMMVLVFSQNANNSHEIKKEIALAGQQQLPVIPVRVEDVLPSGGFLYELATRQWIDLFDDWESAVDVVIRRIEAAEPRPDEATDRADGSASRRAVRRRRKLALIGMTAILAFAAAAAAYLLAPARSPLASFEAAGPETADTRVQAFNIVIRIGSDRFTRSWTRVKPTDWSESAEDGARTFYSNRRRIVLSDCPGTVVQGDEETMKFVFIPDRGCPGMPLKLSYEGGRTWGTVGAMTDVR